MGYSHAWYRAEREFPATQFKKAVEDFTKLLPHFKKMGITLAGGEGEGKPAITPKEIIFNGKGNEGYETFYMPRLDEEARRCRNGFFCYTKTSQMPYDLAVTSALLILKHHMKDNLKVGSDGSIEEWNEAVQLVKKVLGYTEEWSFLTEKKDGVTDTYLVSKEAA